MATQSMEDVPLEMRGTRRAAGPRTMPDADAVKAQRYDALQRRIPSEGNVPAIKLKTGHLLTFEEPHVQFLEAKQIDPRDVESGGWVVDGDYRSSGERSDTLRWAERKLAAQRAQASRAVSSVPTQSTEDVPLEMRGTRRAAGPGPAVNPYRLAGGGIQIPFRASSNFDPNLQQFEDRMRAVVDDPAVSDNLYNQIPDSKGGKVIGTDIYRNVLPEYAQGREGRIGFVNATGRVAQAAAKDRLWREINNRGDRKVLLFTAGGVAAGKSTAVTDDVVAEADLVFDGTLRETDWAKQTIQQALDNGWEVEVRYVQRPLKLVARGAIRRAQQEGRWGPYASVPETHAGAQRSMVEIAKTFEGNPNARFKFYSNEGTSVTDAPKVLSLKDIDTGGKYSYATSDERVSNRQDGSGGPDRSGVGTESQQPAQQSQESGGGSPFTWRVRGYSPAEHLEIFREAARSGDFEPRILRLLAAGNPALEQVVGETAPAVRVEERPGSVSSDPLTPPATVRSGGGTQVPPGAIPVGMAALQTPDWVLARGETSAGRRLIKGVENFRPGQRWGFRSIVDFVNEAVRLEMRRSTTQTSRTHPAHYKPANHVAYTRETQSQINFHEAGHGLEYLLRARLPDVFVPHAAELIALTNRPGSMASDPPASLSPVGQYNYRLGEGVAEWTRLLLTDPATVQNLQVSAAISAAAERFYPGMAKSLRDAARAVNAFQGQDVATRWAMFNAPPNVRPSANELVGAIIRGGEAAVNAIASGAPVSSLDRKITRAIIKQRKETETAYKAALTKARLVRSTNLTPLMSAYNMILSIGAETQLAISGTGTSKGLRIVEEDGSFRYLTGESWTDLRKKVPAAKLAQFDQAAWAKESLNRWENGGLEYPGMREGILPEDLKAIVAMAAQDIPNFTRMYKEQSRFHDLILEVKEAGGLISGMDRARMQGARPGYWPLPRVMTAGRGAAGRGRGDMSAGVYRARGSGEAIRNIDEVTEERTREMFEAYYWNRFGLKLYDNMAAVAKDLSLPAEARILAGSTMVKMKMPMKAAASVSKEEALGWVMKSIGDAYEKVLGFRPEVKAEDVNLSWSFRDVWRPVKPTDVNVVSLLRDGVREYYQLGDPAIFGLFASPQTASKMGKAASWLLGPMTQNWKRNITQGAVFALRNLFRDTFTQTLLNPDPIGWVPGWAHTKGVVNKFTKKYPQVFSEGLLLSRVQPSEQEMLASIKHGAIWQWLSEGFYVSQAKDPVIKTVATVLQPSNWLFPLWKTADLINLVTGGRAMAAFFETAGREGAAVAALQRGATDEEALAKYWTASGQFNEHSGIADARIAMSVPGFLNPMLQGVRNVGQKLSDPDPAVRGTAWTRLLVMIPVMFGGAAIARYLMMDEDDKERERQRVVDDRLSFMDLAGFSVPFPYGPEGVMGSVVYNATMDDLLGRPKVDADRTAIMLLKRIVDPGSGLQFFGPQLATIMEANMNWSTFRQKHIVAPWMVQLPASEQYYSTTPEFYRKVGTMMNYSPAKLQYIVQQALSRQADETLRLAESIDRGRPMMEMADVPFVGRLFVRDPIGFGSQAVRSVTAVEDRLRLLDERLKAKGWNMLRDPEFPAEDLGSDQLRHLQVQLAYMEDLRKGMGVLSGMQGVAKYYSLKRDYANERNMRTVQTRYAQSLLIGNRGQIAELEKALELLKQIPQGSPDQVAAEYLDRRF
jgi:hypothetical protein